MIFEFYKKEIFPIVLTNVYVFSCALGIFAIVFGIPFFSSDVFIDFVNNFILPLLLVLHAGHSLGFLRGFLFIVLASLSGFLFEVSGLRFGALFNNPYIYNKAGLLIHGVPFNVILYWGIFIYIGFSITNLFLHKLKNTPSNILIKVISDGLIVTFIDLLVDPIGVKAGNWTWISGGFYFGIPFGNFVSWFFIVAIVTSIFRIFEYFKPHVIKNLNYSLKVIPLKVYTTLFLVYVFYALVLGLYKLLFIGALPMFGIILLLYYQNKNNFDKHSKIM